MNFVQFLNGGHLGGLQDSVDEELEVSDSCRTSVYIMSSRYRINIRDTWSDLLKQSFGSFDSYLRNLGCTFSTDINNMSVIF